MENLNMDKLTPEQKEIVLQNAILELKSDMRATKEVLFDSSNKEGYITRLKVMEAVMEAFMGSTNKQLDKLEKSIEKLSDRVNTMQWKLSGVIAGVTIITQVVMSYFL